MRNHHLMIEVVGLFLSILLGIYLLSVDAGLGPAVAYPFILQSIFVFFSMRLELASIHKVLGLGGGISRVLPLYQRLNKVEDATDRFSRALIQFTNSRFIQVSDDLSYCRATLNPKEFMDFAEALFGSLGKGDEVFASSLFGGGDYWADKYGERYLRLNQEAAARGCRIRRSFIINSDQTKDEIIARAREQRAFVDTSTAQLADVVSRESGAARDFFIINSSFAADWRFDSKFSQLESVTVMFSPADLSRFKKYQDCILAESEPLTMPDAGSHGG